MGNIKYSLTSYNKKRKQKDQENVGWITLKSLPVYATYLF